MEHLAFSTEQKLISLIQDRFGIEDFMDYVREENCSYIFRYLKDCLWEKIEGGCYWAEDTNFTTDWNINDCIETLIYKAFNVTK